MNPIEQVLGAYTERGDAAYGEDVTQLAHALQTAALAAHEHAPEDLVAAALLHDYGHLLGDGAGHQERGSNALARWFPPPVTEPIRQHVAAKRYLCAIDPTYAGCLSAASTLSLEAQGGPMRADTRKAFEGTPWFSTALQLRRWDDAAKDPHRAVAPLESYRPLLERVLR